MIAGVLVSRYRSLGADPPFGDLRRAHGVAMEGYFWRFSDPASGRVIVALCGVCRSPGGGGGGGRGSWANVALVAHPGGRLWSTDVPDASADSRGFGVRAGDALGAGESGLRVDLGPAAWLDVALSDRWPARAGALGGSGAAHLIPGLGQYWHPHLLGATVRGMASLGGEIVSLDGWDAYAEKNWGAGGFPAQWWWGQAQGFARRDVAVAFAGGELRVGPAALEATGIVVRLGARRIRLGNPLLAPARVAADGRSWSVAARGPVWSVSVRGAGSPSGAHVLPVPDLAAGRSVFTAHEHLAGSLTLVVRRRGRVAFAGESTVAGLEVGGSGRAGPGGLGG